jgi:hypothetical protein
MTPFADTLKRLQAVWAQRSGLGAYVEWSHGRPWVLAEEHRKRNLHREEWWRHIEGREHRWARALNSSQCFAVNLFAPLADDVQAAHAFLRRMLPARELADGDRVEVRFEHSPPGVAERLGECGQPTQIDVFFAVANERGMRGAIGVEVKLSEREFGVCRGWAAARDHVPINPARERCLDARAVLEAPWRECFMAEHEGRKYWDVMLQPDSSFDLQHLGPQDRCPFRHGLYQLMRNRVSLDVLRSVESLAFSDFVVCLHPGNLDARQLPEAVLGELDTIEAFRRLVRPGGLLEWDARAVLEAVVEVGAAPPGWADWMRSKYLLEPAAAG